MQQLLNPFALKYPESVDATLSSQAVSANFNPSGPYAGQYLAAGDADGLVEVWDAESKGLVRVLEGHVKAVSSVHWSRNNRYLLTASHDSTAIIWDLSYLSPVLSARTPISSGGGGGSSIGSGPSSARMQTLRFDAPVLNAQFHPKNSRIVLATTSGGLVLVDLRKGGGKWVLVPQVEDEDERDGMEVDQEEGGRLTKKASVLTSAIWSPCGSRIYSGTNQGEVIIFDPLTRQITHRLKIANATIRQIAFDSIGQNMVISSSDRAIRTFQVSPLTGVLNPVHRFQDLVNRTPWHSVGFSGDGEYVMGGAGHKQAHNVFIWDRDSGVLVKVLEGPRESLIHCDWHPTKPFIASVATSGYIHLWHRTYPDNWAAFAPGFEELEENVDYDEREDEFDIEDEDELTRRKDLEEDIDIDVLTPHTDYPHRPDPVPMGGIPPNLSDEEREVVESAVKAMEDVAAWVGADAADGDGDGDDWVGFFMSVDMLHREDEGEEEASEE